MAKWKSGKSGNPKGRPRRSETEKQQIEEFKQKLKEYSVDAVEVLHSLMMGAFDSSTRFRCATWILEKTYGTSLVAVEEGTEQEKTINIILNPVQGLEIDMEEAEKEIWTIENNMNYAEEQNNDWELDLDEDWGEDSVYDPDNEWK